MYIKWVGEITFGGERWQFYGIRPWSPRCISSSFIYFKLSALGMFQQVSICIFKMSPAVNQWGERVIHWIWEERWEDSYGEISVMKQLRRRSGLSVFAFDHPSRWPDFAGLRASLGLGRVHWALHMALECQDPTGKPWHRVWVRVSELSVSHSWLFCRGFLLFSFWLFNESHVSLTGWILLFKWLRAASIYGHGISCWKICCCG